MKPNISKIKLLTIICMMSLCCCEKYLTEDKGAVMEEEMVLNSVTAYRGVWSYLYLGLENGFIQVYDPEATSYATMLATACDEADNNQPFNPVQRFNMGSWNGVNNPDNHSWVKFYGYIAQANLLKDLSDTIAHPVLTFDSYRKSDPDQYNELKAEWFAYQIDAEFFKAYYHFELWKRFGAIPIVDRTITKEEALHATQQSTEKIVDYIVQKIDNILPLYDKLAEMPGSLYSSSGDWLPVYAGRVTKGAALALKARVLLYAASPLYNNGSYNKQMCDRAAEAAAVIIRSGKYSTEGTNYRDLFLSYDNSENIMDARTSVYYLADGSASVEGKTNYFEKWNYPRTGGLSANYDDNIVGGNAVCPSQNLVDAYRTETGFAADLDFTGYNPYENIVDGRFRQTIIYPGDIFNNVFINTGKNGFAERGALNSTTTGYFLKKFVYENLNLNTGQTTSHVWYLFRYGEVLLNYAEAALNGTKGASGDYGAGITAAQALNKLHARAANSSNVRVLSSEYDYTDELLTNEMIRQERQVELAFEGHRFWDVRRWKIAENTENEPLRGIDYDATNYINPYTRVDQIESRLFTAPKMYYYPIPQDDFINYPSWSNNGW